MSRYLARPRDVQAYAPANRTGTGARVLVICSPPCGENPARAVRVG